MALCLLLFVNFQLICQENSIVLGGKNGWTDFIQNSGIDYAEIAKDTMSRFRNYYLGAEA